MSEKMKSGSWKLEQARLDSAAILAESIVKLSGISSPPIDVFDLIRSERDRVCAFGEDFGDAFDGRLEYDNRQFLLFYNIKYNAWAHAGEHHPRIRFTIAHELGHYYLEAHRQYLMKGGGPHGSRTEFESDNLSEREADSFASGLLMPQFLLSPIVNEEPPTLSAAKRAREQFDVSLTSVLVRWVRLSDFPCAVLSVRGERIEWGFTSEAFKNVGAYRVHREKSVASRCALNFLRQDPTLSSYRAADGWSVAGSWIDLPNTKLEVHEDFVVIPSTRQLLVFLTANEEEVAAARQWED